MQNIDLICVGKLNAPYFAASVAEYQKRLGAFFTYSATFTHNKQIKPWNFFDSQAINYISFIV